MIEEYQYVALGQGQSKQQSEKQISGILISAFEKLAKISPSNQELSRAHQQIAETMKSEFFLKVLMQLLIEHQDNLDSSTVVKQILTTFTTYVRHQQSRSSLVKKINPHQLNKTLIDIFTNQAIKQEHRRVLIKTYPQFIFANGMETIRQQTVDNFCQIVGMITINVNQIVNTNRFLEGDTLSFITLYVPIAHSIMKGPLQQAMMKTILRVFMFPTLVVTQRLIELIQGAINTADETLFIKISYWGQKMMEFLKDSLLATSKDYMHLQRVETLRLQVIYQIIIRSLGLSLKPNEERIIRQLVVPSNGNKFLERINQIKKHSMDIVNFFAKLIVSSQDSKKQMAKEEYAVPIKVIQFVIDNIIALFVQEFQGLQYPKNDLPHKGFYKSFLEALSKIVKILKFYNQSQKYRNLLIFNVCLPLLQRNQMERIVSAADFKGRREDILNMHSMDIPENAVCKLIESYIDKVDGSVNSFTNQIVNMILFHLTANPNHFQKLPQELKETYFFKNTPFVVQIQCGLTVLSLLSYMAPGRDDLVALIQNLLLAKREFFFKEDNPGTFTSAILLCYTYYVDNFYLALSQKKRMTRQFHLFVLEMCCVYIKRYTQIQEKSLYTKQQLLSREIGALQAVDCINNCITQQNFLPALFWSESQSAQEANNQMFLNIFKFLLYELNYELNISIMDILQQFFAQNIKYQCEKGYALKRLHYQYKGVALIIREELSTLIGLQLYKLYNKRALRNQKLMNSKIMNLLQLIFTCCEEPDVLLTKEFLELPTEEDGWRDIVTCIDIYMRRTIVLKKEGKKINLETLSRILQFGVMHLDEVLKSRQMKELFGVFISLMVLQQSLIDQMIKPLGQLLIALLSQEQASQHYEQQLQHLIEECSYLLMIAINTRVNEGNIKLWGQLASFIQAQLAERSSKGYIVFSTSNPYIGKLLAICLVVIFYMRRASLDRSKLQFLWNNIIQYHELYKSISERLIVATTLIQLLLEKEHIPETDKECLTCFKMISTLLYSSTSKLLQSNSKDGYIEDDNSLDSSNSSCDEKQGLNYQVYTISCNEYTEKDSKQAYIISLKNLCHKLRENSPEFLKEAVEQLSHPIQIFLKQRVFYFQGSISQQGIRKIVKVKK